MNQAANKPDRKNDGEVQRNRYSEHARSRRGWLDAATASQAPYAKNATKVKNAEVEHDVDQQVPAVAGDRRANRKRSQRQKQNRCSDTECRLPSRKRSFSSQAMITFCRSLATSPANDKHSNYSKRSATAVQCG